MQTRRYIVVTTLFLVGLVVAWLALPRLPSEKQSATYIKTRTVLKQLATEDDLAAQDVALYLERNNLWKIGSSEQTFYTLSIVTNGEWTVVATPDKSEMYVPSFVDRWLLRDFAKYRFPVMHVTKGRPVVEDDF